MNFKTTLSLLLLLAVVLVASWRMGVFTSEPKSTRETNETPLAETKSQQLVWPELKDVKKIRLDVKGRGYLVFEKDGYDWRIVEPIRARALGWQVRDVLSAVTGANKLQSGIPGEGEFEGTTGQDMGLAEPAAKVTIEADRTVTVLIGRNTYASENTYVQIEGQDEVAVVDVNFSSRIKKDLKEYRDKQLWDIKKDNVTELRLTSREGLRYEFTKDDGRWRVQSPIRGPADKELIEKALDTLVRLRAEGFVEVKGQEELAAGIYGLKKPAWKVTLVSTEEKDEKKSEEKDKKDKDESAGTAPSTQPTIKGTEQSVLIGDGVGLEGDQFYVKLADRNWIATIKKDTVEKITPDPTAWREKKLVNVDRSEITKIEIHQPKETVTLVKEGYRWRVLLPSGRRVGAEQTAVDGLLKSLLDLKADTFIDKPSSGLKSEGLASPTHQITLFVPNPVADLDEPIEAAKLAFGSTTPSKLYRYVKPGDVDYVAAVTMAGLDDLFKPTVAYRDRQMLAFRTDQLVALELAGPNRTYKLTRADKDSPWKIVGPIEADADQETVKDLILACAALKAERYLSGKRVVEKHGLDEPEIALTFTTEQEMTVVKGEPTTTAAGAAPTSGPAKIKIREKHQLHVSKHDGQVYAMDPTAEPPLVAEVSQSLYDDVAVELIDRVVFADLAEVKDLIDKIEIHRAGRSPDIFVKQGEKWQYPKDTIVRIDENEIARLTNALADLLAKRYVTFQVTDKDIERASMARPFLKITVWANGQEHQLKIGRKSSAGRFAWTSNKKDSIIEIATADVHAFDKQLEDFVPEK